MASTGQSKGNELLVYVDGIAIAYCRDSTLNINSDILDMTSKASAGWKETLTAVKGFTIEGSGLVVYAASYGFSDLLDLIENKTQVELYLKTAISGDAAFYGNAYLTSISKETPNEDVSTFSFSFEGDGALAESTTGYETESAAIFSAMTTEPDITRKGYINTLVAALKAAGVWGKLDRLWMFASHAEDSSLLDWIHPSVSGNACTNISNTAFVADEGYTGDGSADYLDTNFNPSADATYLSLNSNVYGVYVRSNDLTDLDDLLGVRSGVNDAVELMVRTASLNTRVHNDNTKQNDYSHGSNIQGLWAIDVDAVEERIYLRGSDVQSQAYPATTIPNADIYLLAMNNAGASLWNKNQISLGFAGGQLTPTEHTDLYTAIQAFMTSLGKQV